MRRCIPHSSATFSPSSPRGIIRRRRAARSCGARRAERRRSGQLRLASCPEHAGRLQGRSFFPPRRPPPSTSLSVTAAAWPVRGLAATTWDHADRIGRCTKYVLLRVDSGERVISEKVAISGGSRWLLYRRGLATSANSLAGFLALHLEPCLFKGSAPTTRSRSLRPSTRWLEKKNGGAERGNLARAHGRLLARCRTGTSTRRSR